MILDGLLLWSNAQDMTQLQAGTPAPSTNSIDLSQARDLGGSEGLSIMGIWNTLPSSATAGATVTVSLQVSSDNVNWTTLETFMPVPVSSVSGLAPFEFRARAIPYDATGIYRYMQLSYTASAALTSGTLTAGINLDVPYRHTYPRNFVA